ncbi:MAG: hypothetical protein O2926_01270 [Actinomycetota bacterium]|nr:hypothetical protein [Actinomycetota bacterium]
MSLNYDWVRTRAAGGQLADFPVYIQIIYFVMFVLMIMLMFWLWSIRKISLTAQQINLAKFLGILFSISTIFQLISRSADERWNAVPAIILAVTFFKIASSN